MFGSALEKAHGDCTVSTNRTISLKRAFSAFAACPTASWRCRTAEQTLSALLYYKLTDVGRPGNCVEISANRILVDALTRPFLFYKEGDGTSPQPSNYVSDQSHERGKRTLQKAWKQMLFSQPPIPEVILLYPRVATAWRVREEAGVTLWAILTALQEICGAGRPESLSGTGTDDKTVLLAVISFAASATSTLRLA